MAKNEMTAGAEHVLAHGTARTRAASGGKDGGHGGGKDGKGGAKHGDGKKKIKRITIEPADDGSHVIRHEHHPPEGEMLPAHKDEVYTAPNTEALKAHLEEHLGGGAGEGGGEEEPAAEEQMAEHAGGEGGAAGASAA